MSNGLPENISDRMPEYMSGRLSEKCLAKFKNICQIGQKKGKTESQEKKSDRMPETIS